jgi:uncharacterized protein HemY
MRAQLERLDRANRWLDEVARLPPGHPDRLRYLSFAEQILEDQPLAARRPGSVAPVHRPRPGRK